jgi:hypothetical protein
VLVEADAAGGKPVLQNNLSEHRQAAKRSAAAVTEVWTATINKHLGTVEIHILSQELGLRFMKYNFLFRRRNTTVSVIRPYRVDEQHTEVQRNSAFSGSQSFIVPCQLNLLHSLRIYRLLNALQRADYFLRSRHFLSSWRKSLHFMELGRAITNSQQPNTENQPTCVGKI